MIFHVPERWKQRKNHHVRSKSKNNIDPPRDAHVRSMMVGASYGHPAAITAGHMHMVGGLQDGGGGARADIGHMTPARAVARRQPDAP